MERGAPEEQSGPSGLSALIAYRSERPLLGALVRVTALEQRSRAPTPASPVPRFRPPK